MSPEDVVLSSDAGETKSFSIVTNLAPESWKVSTKDNWISVSKNATGDAVEVTTQSEIYFKDRTAIIRLEADKTLGIDP